MMSSSSVHEGDGAGSHASLSLANSQTQPTGDDIPLENLVGHLLASKRSLSSISTVWRANEIVTAARTALEESVVLASKTAFLRKGVAQQAKVLRKVRSGIEQIYLDGQRDFEAVIHSLDAADLRLQKTMDVLRSTMAEAAFRPAGEEPRSLLDFVDESGVEKARTALKASIDQSQEAREEFLESIQSYDTDIKSIKSTMSSTVSSSQELLESPIPALLHSLEENATEMASLLQSLVSHFDLCVNAIKHTDGGFAAVKQAANNNQLPDGITVSGVIDGSSNDLDNLEPPSDEERRQMLTVLGNDAAEVEDVVQELHARLSSMGEQYEQIQDHVAVLTTSYKSTIAAFHILETIGLKLPVYIASGQDFILQWSDFKVLLGDQMEELESMRVFYETYLSCYDGLIIEVNRRRASEEKMKAILRKAMEQFRKLHEADTKEREAFRRTGGDFLPSDLWPGLVTDAPKYEIGIVDNEEGEDEASEIGSTPELDTKVVEAAAKRRKESSRK